MIAQSFTLVSYAERFILQRDLDVDYVQQIRSRCKLFEDWAGHAVMLEEMSDDLVNGFLVSLKGKLSPRTIKGYRGTILAVWNSAAEDKQTRAFTPQPGRIRIEKVPEQIIDAWDKSEIKAILEAARSLPGFMPRTNNKVLLSHWWDARLRVGYDTTLRHSDVMSLKKTDIRFDGVIEICQDKTGHRHIVQLSAKTLECVRAVGGDSDFVFPWPWHREKFFRDLKAIRNRAGINRGTGKWLRRSGASYADAENPGAGKRLLGHRSDRVFSESYECKRITQPGVVRPPELD